MQPIFITGIGTDIGKTVVSAVVTEALQADYWKPIQAGYEDGTDALRVQALVSNTTSVFHPEMYRLALPASPHLAAREENITIDLDKIKERCLQLGASGRPLVVEGAGGILVPLNEQAFVADLIQQLDARVLLVSRNYLGSINHSLLTAALCKQKKLRVAGWIFNDFYGGYEKDIERWSGFPLIGCLPFSETIDQNFVRQQAAHIQSSLQRLL